MALTTRMVAIWADTIRVGKCRAQTCRARIYFAETVARGKNTPFSGDPIPHERDKDKDTGREIWRVPYESIHFRDCREANRFSATGRS